ncbi:MAG TPA: glutamate-cysteine ligase family protein [Myxococcota bacterium]|nr:glutamate-cysteine ligase family protein [Myxococcota bacterium]
MSQPKIYGPDEQDPLACPLVDVEQLMEVFFQAERRIDQRLFGVEYEIFGQIHNGSAPIPYEGPISITSLFKHLAERSVNFPDPMHPMYEGEHIVALSCKRAIIALEPGGQLEIAARPHRHLFDVTGIFADLVKEIEDAALELGINLFALGIHPMASREDMAQVKKARYSIMRQYMGGLYGLGLDMMTRSCAIQINLDYQNQKDMVEKIRLGAALVPFYSLLCSSAAFVDGKPASHAIERGHVWRMTDPDRTGLPPIIFAKDFGYRSWIDMVLDVPMYFCRRNDSYVDLSGASFRDFMARGLNGHRATVRDFVDHMTTVFTEVRLKPILELRSTDSLPVPFANALFALTWALFYDDKAHDEAQEIFFGLTHQELKTLHNAVIDHGKQAKFRDELVFDTLKRLFAIAESAMIDLAAKSLRPELANLLAPLATLLEKNLTFAEEIKGRYPYLDHSTLPALVRDFAPFNNPLS